MLKSTSQWDNASLSILFKSVILGPLLHAGEYANEWKPKKEKKYLILNTIKLNHYKRKSTDSLKHVFYHIESNGLNVLGFFQIL